jgi:hypothetical protein
MTSYYNVSIRTTTFKPLLTACWYNDLRYFCYHVIINNKYITVPFPWFVSNILVPILYIHNSHRYWWRLRLRVPDVGVLAMRGFPENKTESMTVDHNMWRVWRIPPSMHLENHFVDVENDMHIVTAIKVIFVSK